jgi:hypothetical protein
MLFSCIGGALRSDHVKSTQTSAVDERALEMLLDTMDVNNVSDEVEDMMMHEVC